MSASSITARDMTKIALCVAFCCVTAYISFPLPFTPGMVTALTLALGVTAFVLPPKQTFLALFLYVLLGCIGLPVFVGGTAGFGKLFGPTGSSSIRSSARSRGRDRTSSAMRSSTSSSASH